MLFLFQVEYFDDKDRHLCAGDETIGTIFPAAATAGHAFGRQLFDPGRRPVGGGDVGKAGAGTYRRRSIG